MNDEATVVVPPTISVKKDKREAEESIEKQTSEKKQKRDGGEIEQSVEKKKSEAKSHKKKSKKEETTTSNDTFASDSEEEQKEPIVKPMVPSKKQLLTASKNGTVEAPAKKHKLSSSANSSEDSDSEEDEKKVASATQGKKLPHGTAKTEPTSVPKKGEETSDSSSDSYSDEETDTQRTSTNVAFQSKKSPATAAKNGSVVVFKKKEMSSDGSEDGSSSDDEDENHAKVTSQAKKLPTSAPKNVPMLAFKEGTETTDSSEDSDSDDEEEETAAAPTKKVNSSDSSSDSDSKEEEAPTKRVFPSKRPISANETKESKQKKEDLKEDGTEVDSYEESDDEERQKKKMKVLPTGAPIAGKQSAKATKSGDSSDEEISDNEPKVQLVKKLTKVTNESSSEEGSSREDTSEEEKEQPSRTSKENDVDVEMVDMAFTKVETKQADSRSEKKAAKNPVTPEHQNAVSKTLFVGNLSFSIEKADVENFFKDAGEIFDIRFAIDNDIFKGYGHVEFATVEAAKKALKLDGKDLLGRRVRLDLARERGSYTPFSSNERNSYQKGGKAQGRTIFVRGFDKSGGDDKIRGALEEHFGSCGEFSRVSIPKDYDGGVKGFAYIDFRDSDGFNKALELNGSELAGSTLTVEEAKSKGDYRDRAGSGRVGGWRSSGRDAGSWFGDRHGGGHSDGFNKVHLELNGSELAGSSLTVEEAKPKGDYRDRAGSGRVGGWRSSGRDAGSWFGDRHGGGSSDGFNKALELNGSELASSSLTVEEAKPKGDYRDRAGSGRVGGWRSSGRDAGSWFGDRHGGGRSDGFNKAHLELNGSELAGSSLTVEEAKPKGDYRDRAGSGRVGGWSSGRDAGSWFGDRHGGGRSDGFNKTLELNGCELAGSSLTVEEAKLKGDYRDRAGSGRVGAWRSSGRDAGSWFGDRHGGGRGGGGQFGDGGIGR